MLGSVLRTRGGRRSDSTPPSPAPGAAAAAAPPCPTILHRSLYERGLLEDSALGDLFVTAEEQVLDAQHHAL